jgi:spore maturation protein CgeB
MYPYRKEIFDELEHRGLAVELNPHRNYLEPNSYLSYLTALHLSTFTINLSQAGGVKVKQLKCRVLETAIFGKTLITDENVSVKKFFKRNSDLVYIKQINKLSQVMLEGKSLPHDKKNQESAYQHAMFNFFD